MVAKYTKDIQDVQAMLYEESQMKLKLSMELDTKESDLEILQNKLAHLNMDTARWNKFGFKTIFNLFCLECFLLSFTNFCSLSSGTGDFGDNLGSDGALISVDQNLEGWLQTPSRQNIRRHGWRKLYVTVSSKKIIFFNSETERQNSDATLIIDLK